MVSLRCRVPPLSSFSTPWLPQEDCSRASTLPHLPGILPERENALGAPEAWLACRVPFCAVLNIVFQLWRVDFCTFTNHCHLLSLLRWFTTCNTLSFSLAHPEIQRCQLRDQLKTLRLRSSIRVISSPVRPPTRKVLRQQPGEPEPPGTAPWGRLQQFEFPYASLLGGAPG
jgi:hypothetical protein